jgi:hypothetical protein
LRVRTAYFTCIEFFKAGVKSDRAERLIFMIHLPTGVGLTDAENGELQIKHGRVLRTSCMATVMWWAWVWHPSA